MYNIIYNQLWTAMNNDLRHFCEVPKCQIHSSSYIELLAAMKATLISYLELSVISAYVAAGVSF